MNKVLHCLILILLLNITSGNVYAQITTTTKKFTPNSNEALLLAPAQMDGKWGFIDEKGTFTIPATFAFVSDFSEGLASVKVDELWGYIDRNGTLTIAPKYKNAYNFKEGIARIQMNGKWGYIDAKGQLIVQAIFDAARDFSDGLAAVQIDNQYGYIDKRGKYVIHPQFDQAFDFAKGMALIRQKGKSQYITKRNSYISPVFFDGAAYSFSENLAVVKEGNLYGYIDKNGNYVIEPKFDYAEGFVEGIAVVLSNQNYGYINQKGEFLLQPGLEAAQHFSEGLAAVRVNQRWGYINKKGNYTINPQFDYAEPFIDGRAKVKVANKYGFINTEGRFVVDPVFDWAFDFEESKAAVLKKETGYGYIDTEGQIAVPCEFEAVGSFRKVNNYKKPSSKPMITYLEGQNTPVTEKSEYLLQANIQSETPILEYLVFINNKLHDIKGITNKGTTIRPMAQNSSAFHRNILTSITLSDGLNEIYIKAINDKGTTDSEVLEVIYQPSAEIERPDLYVLTIGVSEHKYGQYNLNFADDDANDMANVFRKQQQLPQNRRLFDNIIVETLVDAQATTPNIKRSLLDIKRKVNKDDMVILHISSHGEFNGKDKLFIRTYDTDPGIEFLPATALSTAWISETIKDFECTVVQFFDACHSGGASGDLAYKGVPNDIVVRELKEALATKALYFFASSSSTELSQERKEWRNGAFTEAILSCFAQKVFTDFNKRDIIADRDKDGYINMNEMSNYVSKVVRVLTKGTQRPKATFENSEPINIFVLD